MANANVLKVVKMTWNDYINTKVKKMRKSVALDQLLERVDLANLRDER